MLDLAIKYEEDLRYEFYNTWLKEEYKYFFTDGNFFDFEIYDTTENTHQFVSRHRGQIIGFISYDIHRNENRVDNFGAINFTDEHMIFAGDLMKVIHNIFYKYNYEKINFDVVVGNPAEEKYDKLIRQLGGRVVGTYKNHTKLMDGKVYDVKIYEIFRRE